MSENTYRTCPECKRQIVESLYMTASAHGPGCSVRRSLLGKAAYQEKQKRVERAQRAAELRGRRRTEG